MSQSPGGCRTIICPSRPALLLRRRAELRKKFIFTDQDGGVSCEIPLDPRSNLYCLQAAMVFVHVNGQGWSLKSEKNVDLPLGAGIFKLVSHDGLVLTEHEFLTFHNA